MVVRHPDDFVWSLSGFRPNRSSDRSGPNPPHSATDASNSHRAGQLYALPYASLDLLKTPTCHRLPDFSAARCLFPKSPARRGSPLGQIGKPLGDTPELFRRSGSLDLQESTSQHVFRGYAVHRRNGTQRDATGTRTVTRTHTGTLTQRRTDELSGRYSRCRYAGIFSGTLEH